MVELDEARTAPVEVPAAVPAQALALPVARPPVLPVFMTGARGGR